MSKRPLINNGGRRAKRGKIYHTSELLNRLNNTNVRLQTIQYIIRRNLIYNINDEYKALKTALISAFNGLTDVQQREMVLTPRTQCPDMPYNPNLELLTIKLSNLRPTALFDFEFLNSCQQQIPREIQELVTDCNPGLLAHLVAINNDLFGYLTGFYANKQTGELVRMVVTNKPAFFQMFLERFRNSEDIAIAAVSRQGIQLQSVSNRLRRNVHVVLAAVSQNGYALKWASIKTVQIVTIAVNNNPDALEFAGGFQDNDDVVMSAIKKRGTLLKYASERLKNNIQIIMSALRQNKSAIVYIGRTYDDSLFNGRMASHRHSVELRQQHGSMSHFIGAQPPLTRQQQFSAARYFMRIIEKKITIGLLRVLNKSGWPPDKHITDFLHHELSAKLKF